MRLIELIGKMAVRTKALTRMEYEHGAGFSLSGRYIELPDNRWCTDPIKVIAIEEGVVYIERKKFFGDDLCREILDPKYNDEHWAPVNEAHLYPKDTP